jgi:hypothetical protein
MNKILTKMQDHFEGDSAKAFLAFGLLAAGILVFIINNTMAFFVGANAYFWPRTIMKALTDICWVAAAMLGTHYYPTRRNVLLPVQPFLLAGGVSILHFRYNRASLRTLKYGDRPYRVSRREGRSL